MDAVPLPRGVQSVTRSDVEVAGMSHGEKVTLYQVDEPDNQITATVDDLVEDPDALADGRN